MAETNCETECNKGKSQNNYILKQLMSSCFTFPLLFGIQKRFKIDFFGLKDNKKV